MLGLGMAKKGVFATFAKKFEKWCLTSADKVSTISKTMLSNASGKGVPQSNLIFFLTGLNLKDLRMLTV